MPENTLLAYITSSKTDNDTGVYICELDRGTGALKQVDAITAIRPAHYLAFHSQKPLLYVTGTNGGDVEVVPGSIGAFSLDPHTGKATYLNRQPTNGVSPCYVSVDGTGHYVLVANYNGDHHTGCITVFPISADGQIGEATDSKQHQGKSVNPDRQNESHTHMIAMDQVNQRVLVTDLGTDKIMVYGLDFAAGKLIAHTPPFASVKGGAGPRHLAFTQKSTYLINELDNTVITFDYDSANGIFTERQTISTLPDGYAETTYAADINIAPSGRFLYGSNRGHNSISIFAIDSSTGELSDVGWESTQGNWPRSFAIDPGGTFLIVTNERSDNVATFWIDQTSGKLTPTGYNFAVPAPGCVKAWALKT